MPRPPPPGSLILGLGIVLSGNVFTCGLLGLVSGLSRLHDAASWLMMAPGLTQMLWLLPLGAVLLFFRRRHTVVGMAVMALVVLLANGLGWGLAASGLGVEAPPPATATP